MKNIIHTFATHFILRGGVVRQVVVAGIFLCLYITYLRFCTPVWSVNAPTALQRWNATGKAEPFFISAKTNILSVMHSTQKICLTGKSMPQSNTPDCESVMSFQFDGTIPVQVVVINEQPYFVAADVCRVLGLSNPTKALYALDNDEYLPLLQVRAGQQRTVNVVNESGLYTLMLRCRDAVNKGTTPYKFRKWITSEVLPSIRKTGTYVAPSATPPVEQPYQWTDPDERFLNDRLMGSSKVFLVRYCRMLEIERDAWFEHYCKMV